MCGESYVGGRCEHVIGRTYDGRECTATYGGDLSRVEAVEGSLVYLGAQYGAVVTKEVEPPAGSEEEVMELEQARVKIAELEERLAAAGCQPPVMESVVGAIEAVKEAAESRAAALAAELAREKERQSALAADGAAYRADLKGQVLRLAGLVGAGKEAALLVEALADAPAERWKALKEEYERRVEERFPPRGVGEVARAAETGYPAVEPRGGPGVNVGVYSVV